MELLIIVIGILLALTIDEWVSEYKYKQSNYKLIDEMYLEVEEDIEYTNESIKKLEAVVADLETYIEEVKANPEAEARELTTIIRYDRNLFWQTISTKADLSLLEKEDDELVRSIFSLNVMQDAVQEHYEVIRKFLFSICETHENMRVKCLEKSLHHREYLIVLLKSEKARYQQFKQAYERFKQIRN